MTWVRIERPDAEGNLDGYGWLHLDEPHPMCLGDLRHVLSQHTVDGQPAPLQVRMPAPDEIADFLLSDWVRHCPERPESPKCPKCGHYIDWTELAPETVSQLRQGRIIPPICPECQAKALQPRNPKLQQCSVAAWTSNLCSSSQDALCVRPRYPYSHIGGELCLVRDRGALRSHPCDPRGDWRPRPYDPRAYGTDTFYPESARPRLCAQPES